MKTICFTILLLAITTTHANNQNFDSEQKAIISQMNSLSSSMYKDGNGGKAYATILAPTYTRWTSGSDLINDRVNWLKGINDWFNSGWRIANSQNNILEIEIHGDFAFVRRVATETYVGPKGENQIFQSGVVEVWTKKNSVWLLLQASISPKQIK